MQVSQRNRIVNRKDKPLGLSFDNEPYLITFNYSHSNSNINVEIKDIFNKDPLLDDNAINLDIYLSTINKLVIEDDKIRVLI